MSLNGPRARSDEGAIAILVAIFMVVIIAMAAVVVDLGMAYNQRRIAQKAADLAALAAGQDLLSTGDPGTDEASAAQTAATYLSNNGYPGVTASDLTNGLLADGEIVFPENTSQFEPIAACPSSAIGSCAEVITPTKDVQYVFSPAMGALLGSSSPSKGSVSAEATVAVRSLGNILPFLFSSSVSPGGTACTKYKSNMSICNDNTNKGNFGFLNIPRLHNDNQRLTYNLHYGVEITPTVIPNSTVISDPTNVANGGIGWQCFAIDSPMGAVPTNFSNPASGYNCVTTETGSVTTALNNAWIQSTLSGANCDGRLSTGPAGSNTCTLTPDNFATYDLGSKGLSPSIVQDPRFGLVPVIAKSDITVTGVAQYAIVKFYGIYIKTLYDNSGKSVLTSPVKANAQIGALDSYVFDLGQIDFVTSNSGSTTTYFGGPRVPVLVR